MAGALGIDADAVVGKLIRVWGWFDKHTEDGNAVGVTFSLLDRISGVTGFAEQMELCGWLTQSGHVLSIPKFDHHNGKTAKNRALTAKRVAKSKVKSNAEGNAPIVTEALPREEKRREDKDKPVKKSKSRIPECFQLSERVLKWAAENGHDRLKERLEQFVSYAKRNGKEYVDWDEAFMGAVRENWAKLPEKQKAAPEVRAV